MKNILFYILFIVILSVNNFGFSQDMIMKKEQKDYKILELTETKRYWVFEAVTDKNPVILVVDKKSNQIKDKRILKGTSYSFKTYSFWDVFAFGEYFHEVDGIKVWSSDDFNKELHFTDGMGNDYYEDEEKED